MNINRAREIFEQALEFDDENERQKFIDRQCADDQDLREHVLKLLSLSSEDTADFFAKDSNATASFAADKRANSAADSPLHKEDDLLDGKYKLRELIGEGGMGTVWLAEQISPVKRKVAIKMIKPGMDSKQVIARFEAERQALAMMNHANIAQVLDGGITEKGHPYFVMEYFKGVPLTAFCGERRLTVEDRLELFLQICHAVQHAHQKGVVHRDLKPSNILVGLYDGKAIPKVIDFGLAKALHQPLTEKSLFTGHGQLMGTLLYMSPEQATLENLDIDTGTDVYSLGVILYELLTGTTPITKDDLDSAALMVLLREIREKDSPRPSDRISGSNSLPLLAEQRATTPKQLRSFTAGDLDWITMKALEKERIRRYPSASSFASDIQRFLNDEPIEARPPSTFYKLGRFVKRNRMLVAGTVATVVLLLTAMASLTAYALEKSSNAEQTAKLEREKREVIQKTYVERLISDARSSGKRGQWALMLSQLNDALELGYENPIELQFMKIAPLDALGKKEERDRLVELLEEDPGEFLSSILLWKAEFCERRGEYPQADKLISMAVKEGLSDADVAYAKGIQATDIPTAIQQLEKSIEYQLKDPKKPFHYRASYMLAVEYFLIGEKEKARSLCFKMINLFPSDVRFPFVLGLIDCIDRKYSLAKSRVEKVPNVDDDSVRLASNIFKLFERANSSASTVSQMTAALEVVKGIIGQATEWKDNNLSLLVNRRLRKVIGNANTVFLQDRLAAIRMNSPRKKVDALRRIFAIVPEGSIRTTLAIAEWELNMANKVDLKLSGKKFLASLEDALQLDFISPKVRAEAFSLMALIKSKQDENFATQRKDIEQYLKQEFPEPPHQLSGVLALLCHKLGDYESSDHHFSTLMRVNYEYEMWGEGVARHWSAVNAVKLGDFCRAQRLSKGAKAPRTKAGPSMSLAEVQEAAKRGLQPDQ